MESERDASPLLLLALEAVVHTEQLAEVRSIIDQRLAYLPEPARWQVVLAASELVTTALLDDGRCTGLRIYDLGRVGRRPVIRIEVDDPSPVVSSSGPDDGRAALAVVAALADRWGRADPSSTTVRNEPRPSPVGTTVWCELHLER